MIQKIRDTSKLEHLFHGWEETLIWSCMQGVMGAAYAEIHEDREGQKTVRWLRIRSLPWRS